MFSCNDKEEFFKAQNSSPTIGIRSNGTMDFINEITDSVKISLKSSRKSLDYRLIVSDLNEDISSVSTNWVVGDGTVQQNGMDVTTIDFNEELIDISVTPTELGTNILEIIVRDAFGVEDKVKVVLIAFLNETPIAVLPESLENVRVINDLHYVLDASSSFDNDREFGGGIILYEYTIEGNTFSAEESKINYIFSSRGNKLIKLRVKDSDGIWSTRVEDTFSVN